MNSDIVRNAKWLPIKNMIIYYPQAYINIGDMIDEIISTTDIMVDINDILIVYNDNIAKNTPSKVFREIRDNIEYENNLHIGFFVEGESKDCESVVDEAKQLLSFISTYKFNPDLPIFYYYNDSNLNSDIYLAIIKEFMDTIKNNSEFKVGFCTDPNLLKNINTDIISEYDYLSYNCGSSVSKVYDPVIVIDNKIDCVGWIYSDDKFRRYSIPTFDFKYAFLYTDYNVTVDHPIGDEPIIDPKTGDIRFRRWISPREYIRNDIVRYEDGTFRIYGQNGLTIYPTKKDNIYIKNKDESSILISCDDDGYMKYDGTMYLMHYSICGDNYKYFIPNKRIKDVILESFAEEQEIVNDQIMIKLCNNKYGYWFGHCIFCFDDIKKSIDSIDVYLYNAHNSTHHTIEQPLSLSIGDLMNAFNSIGVITDSVGNFENEYTDYHSIKDHASHKISYSIADLIDTIYCSLPDDYDNERMLFLYRSYFDIILKKLLPNYYIVDPISNVQVIPIEASDMVKQIDHMFKNIRHLSTAFRVSCILLLIVCIANILIYLFR